MPRIKIPEDVFISRKEAQTLVMLPGIGRFCKCGCNRHITGRKDKIFFNQNHKHKYYERQGKHRNNYGKETLPALIKLRLEPDGTRIIRLYLKKNIFQDVKITKNDKLIWDALERIKNFRNISNPMNNTETVVRVTS